MFNIGIGEITVILIAALLVMGPDRLPEFARTLGKFLREFRKQTDGVRGVVLRELYKLEREADLQLELEDEPRIKPRLPSPSPVVTSAPVEAAVVSEPVVAESPAAAVVTSAEATPSAALVQAAASAAPVVSTASAEEANVTVVGGVRIAPAVGTVARGAVRARAPEPAPAAAPLAEEPAAVPTPQR